jgi:pyrroloquinoline quinone biosynthesis protein B
MEGASPVIGAESGSTVGILLLSGGRRVAYVPGCAAPSPTLAERIDGADLLLFDGTLFGDDEMITSGVGTKTGRRMGHMPMSGPGGSMATLASARVGRRVFVHINNTNPALIEGSSERRAVEASGWTVAHDGMAFSL